MGNQPSAKARARSGQGSEPTTTAASAASAIDAAPAGDVASSPPGGASADRREEVLEAPAEREHPNEDAAALVDPALQAAGGDSPVLELPAPSVQVRLVGLPEGELAEVAAVEIPLGMELGCANFEDGKLRVGLVVSVSPENNGIVLDLVELDWVWPVRLDRVDLGRGEWTHMPEDYPAPGTNKEWDRAHRMSEADRREEVLEAPAEREHPNEEDDERETATREAAQAEEDQREARGGALATWLGPGQLHGPWVRESDGRVLNLASRGDKGYFSLRTIDHAHFKGKFEVHKRPSAGTAPVVKV